MTEARGRRVDREHILKTLAAGAGCDLAVCKASACMCREQTGMLLDKYVIRHPTTVHRDTPYTIEEEAEIIRLYAEGREYAEIAAKLNRTPIAIDRKIYRLRRQGSLCDKSYRRSVTIRPLVPRDIIVLQNIRDFVAMHGYSPTYRELVDSSGLKTTIAVTRALGALTRHGLIDVAVGVARGIQLIEPIGSGGICDTTQ